MSWHAHDVAINAASGRPMAGVKVQVLRSADLSPANLYSNRTGTPLANPVTTDADGNYDFYIVNGTYDLEFRVGSQLIKAVRSLELVSVYDELDALEGMIGADKSQVATFTTTAGQTRFPPSGPLIDDLGFEFDGSIRNVLVTLSGTTLSPTRDFDYGGGSAPVIMTSPQPAGLDVVVVGQPLVGKAAPPTGEGVPLHSYAGTSIAEDPNRWDHSNAQLAAAQADTTDPTSPNFGKWIDIYPFKGEGKPHDDEANGVVSTVTGKAVPAKFLAALGDTLIDCWSQNGVVPDNYPTAPIYGQNQQPGNLVSGSRIRILDGARVRRAPRPNGGSVLRPLIFCGDPNPTSATTVNGVDTQSDVYLNNEIVCVGSGCFLGEVHRWKYREHHNDISLNGFSDFSTDTMHLGQMSDGPYAGAGNVGGGSYNRRNKRGRIRFWADGLDTNNRNGCSIVSGEDVEILGYSQNVGKAGGAAALDPANPATGVPAPAGGLDCEPDVSFTTDPHVRDIRGHLTVVNSGATGVALLLGNNNNYPTPTRGFRLTCVAYNCQHGAFSTIGANDQRVGYDAILTGSATDCYRPFEILSGQEITLQNFKALRSAASAYIGYFSQRPQDFWLDNVVLQECGRADTAAVQVFGWKGGGRRNVTVTDGGNRAYHYLNGLPIEGLTLVNDLYRRTGTTGAPVMTFGDYVDTSNGSGLVVPGSITTQGAKVEGAITNYRWAPPGSKVSSVPIDGAYKANQIVFAADWLPPGSPFSWRTVAANAAGTVPAFVVHQIMGGANPDPSVSGLPTFTLTNMVVTNGRFTAMTQNARAVSTSSYNSFDVQMRGVYPGSGTVYFGLSKVANPTSTAQLWGGWWLGDDGPPDEPKRAKPIYNGGAANATPASVPEGYDTIFRVTGSTGAATQFAFQYSTDNGSTWTTASAPNVNVDSAPLYPVVFINARSETGQLLRV
jgi:hypothetical protein